MTGPTEFFAGYRIDSVADLFLKTFGGGATSRAATLTKLVGGANRRSRRRHGR